MSNFAKSININEFDEHEMSGGYDISELLNEDGNMEGGGQDNIFTDMQVPIGLYCNNNVVCDFYKVVKSSVIEDDLFDNLLNMVSKIKNTATRREPIKKHKVTKKMKSKI
jgi:hypothetical protein